jgi:hypothetical protein
MFGVGYLRIDYGSGERGSFWRAARKRARKIYRFFIRICLYKAAAVRVKKLVNSFNSNKLPITLLPFHFLGKIYITAKSNRDLLCFLPENEPLGRS